MVLIATAALSKAGAELALNSVCRNTGTRPTAWYIGLATSAVAAGTTLASVAELTTAGYARVAVTFNAPSGTSPVTVVQSADLTFGPFSADPPSTAYAFLTEAASGTSGSIWARWTGTAFDAGLGESVTIPAGTLSLYIATAEAS